MIPVQFPHQKALPDCAGSFDLCIRNDSHNSNNVVRGLLLFCILAIIVRQTVLVHGRSLAEFTAVDIYASLDIAIVCLAVFVLVFSGSVGRTWSLLRRTPALWLCGYYAFCATSSLWSALPIYSLYRALEYLVLFFAAFTAIAQYPDFAAAERAFLRVGMMTIVLEMCLNLRYLGFSLSLQAWHTNTYGASAAMLFCYCLGEYLAMTKAERSEAQKRSRRLRRFGIFSLCILALSTSSASNVATTLGCLLIFLLLRRFWLVLSGLCFGLLLFLSGRGGGIFRVLLFPGKSEQAIEGASGRLYLWEFCWHKFLQSPAVGYGFGAFRVISKGLATHAHNAVFSVLIGTGMVGVILFALFALRLWWITIVEVWRRGVGTVGFAGALAAAFVNSLGIPLMADRWIPTSIVFVWLLGLFLVHVRAPRRLDSVTSITPGSQSSPINN